MKKISLLLALFSTSAWAATNNLPQVTASVVLVSHGNLIRTALSSTMVPRNASGSTQDISADLGSSTYRWNHTYTKDIKLQQDVSGNQVTINSPTSLAANYTITVPAALPGSTLPISMSSAGLLSTGQILTAQITDANVTLAKLASNSVDSSKIVDGSVASADIETSTNLQGNNVRANGKSLVTLYSGLGALFTIVRGSVASDGSTIFAGEGWTNGTHAMGVYRFNYSVAFTATPVVTVSPVGANVQCNIASSSTTALEVDCYNDVSGATNTAVNFLAVGPS